MHEPPKTRAQAVFAALRADILAGRLLPGAKLPFAELTERYGCSMSVVREGLSRLVELGLVRNEPQHGFHVTSLSPVDLEDLTTARVHIEGLALGYAIDHGDLAWEAGIVAAEHALARTPTWNADDVTMNEEWTALHAAFHRSLLAACPNIRLRTIADELRDAAELYRRWTKRLAHDDDRDIGSEHTALMDAVLRRDRTAAIALLEQHLRRTADVLLAVTAPPDATAEPQHATPLDRSGRLRNTVRSTA